MFFHLINLGANINGLTACWREMKQEHILRQNYAQNLITPATSYKNRSIVWKEARNIAHWNLVCVASDHNISSMVIRVRFSKNERSKNSF